MLTPEDIGLLLQALDSISVQGLRNQSRCIEVAQKLERMGAELQDAPVEDTEDA